MRIKAIPAEIIATAKGHPYAVAIAVAAIGAVWFISAQSNSLVSEVASNEGYNSNSYPLIGTGLVGGLSMGSSGSDGGMNNAALIGIEQTKANNEQEIALQQLQLNSDIAANNFELGTRSISASNFSTAAMLATSMLGSQSTSLLASFMLPNGESMSFGLAQTKASGSKLKSRNTAIANSNAQGFNALNDFIKLTGSKNVPLSTTGTPTSTITGSVPSAMPSNNAGSAKIAPAGSSGYIGGDVSGNGSFSFNGSSIGGSLG